MTTMRETAAALSETVLAAKAAAIDLGRSASNMADQARADTAANLHSAASTVRAAGARSAEFVEEYTSDASRRLDSTSSYIRKHDGADMLHDMRRIVRRHPGAFVLFTAAVALCAGYLLAPKPDPRRT